MGARRHIWAFWTGCGFVACGVLLHLPMLWTARSMGFHLAGMGMDTGMIAGMGLIVAGIALAAYGLLPVHAPGEVPETIAVRPAEAAALTPAHWGLMAVLIVALVIDVMKPASLGFVVPGMMDEYGISPRLVSFLPFAALAGTVAGSLAWGAMADRFGRRASILLAAVMFMGTAICGAMPSFWWNVGMCFLMGAAAGGLLPVAYALLAETMPAVHRSWSLVLVGGLGGVGGYFAASALSALLQPLFGWRVMWLLNLPTGLILVLLSGFIPESARFLIANGHTEAARRTLARFGSAIVPHVAAEALPVAAPRLLPTTIALSTAALVWGLINFGLLLWLPANLAAEGYGIALASKLLASSALIAAPTVFLAAALYNWWSTKWALVAAIAVSALGLAGILLLEHGAIASPVLPVALLIVGSNALLAILLPYAAESYPLRIRGRATGWVAGCTKSGGLVAQLLGIVALVPPLGTATALVMAPTLASIALVARFGAETRGRDLHGMDGRP